MLLPELRSGTNKVRRSKREILDGVLYQLKNGCPKGYRSAYNWVDLPHDLPPYSTVFWHYKQWRAEGTIKNMMIQLHHHKLFEALEEIYPSIMRKIRFQLSAKPSKAQKKAQGKIEDGVIQEAGLINNDSIVGDSEFVNLDNSSGIADSNSYNADNSEESLDSVFNTVDGDPSSFETLI